MKALPAVALVFLAAVGVPLYAQSEAAGHSEVTVSAIGAFTYGVSGYGVNQTATYSGGVLASYRYLFTVHHAVEVDYSHTQFTQQYTVPPTDFTGRVHSDLDEFTASYVFRYPISRVTPFASAGTGSVSFNPSQIASLSPLIAGKQALPVFTYGAGIDVRCTNWLFLRAGYRGLVYGAPDFGVEPLTTNAITYLAEPTIGFGIRF